jgi:hypothetical protein
MIYDYNFLLYLTNVNGIKSSHFNNFGRDNQIQLLFFPEAVTKSP